MQRSISPPRTWNGNAIPAAGTRDNPLQICESDEEDGTPVGPGLRPTRRQARVASRHGKIDLGMIELSDSEPEVVHTATADPPGGRKRKKASATSAIPKEEPRVDLQVEAGVLQHVPPYKQRKLNYAGASAGLCHIEVSCGSLTLGM